MPTIALLNLGCAKNIVDGQKIIGSFGSNEYPIVEEFDKAEIIIVNTCAFIQEAKEEAISSILEMAEMKKKGICRTLCVAGCFSERYKEETAHEFPEVDAWLSVDNWHDELVKLFKLHESTIPVRHLTELTGSNYLKIAEGCSHGCSFCVIPAIRGAFTSRPVADIIAEAQWMYDQGIRECILVAQDSSFYGRDIGTNLTALLEELLRSTKFPWIRIMYLHPRYVDDALLDLVAREKRMCPYFDIPLQHASDAILTSMQRTPLRAGLEELIGRIRTKIPHAAIRTSFILGYPGETDKDFSELCDFVEKMRFNRIGVFPFSPEEDTAAYSLRPRPRSTTVQRRCEELMEIQRQISRELLEEKVGQVVEVMIDDVAQEPGYNYRARTRYDAPEVDGTLYIEEGSCTPGQLATVTITSSSDHDLYGVA